MEVTGAVFKYSLLDFLFSCVGLPMFLADIVLDILIAVSFYQDEAYVCLGVLLLLLVGSSVLVQVYSWLWYSYDNFEMKTKFGSKLSYNHLKLLHVFQLGIYFRHAGVFLTGWENFRSKRGEPEGFAVYMNHDLSMLRILETFSESAPQLVLMLSVILRESRLDHIEVLKTVFSASTVAFCVTMYHRSLRSFLPDKEKQSVKSSIVYFFWNLLLILSRLTALALFASVLPCFIFAHFLCSWLVFFFCAWRAKTEFMECKCGEWLYRATVGLIWYVDWFNVVDGKTRNKTLLYHAWILVDVSVLCSLWCWKMTSGPPVVPHLNVIMKAVCVVALYIVGLLLKLLYYKCYHPSLGKEELKGDSPDEDVVDCGVAFRSLPAPPTRLNRRMRKQAESFYS
ncbi:XK-related protein 8-like [Brachyistius frenatus]|uniref:XK-related protein 8-like n=1 Tax=Brachyistius frenatus TaxID=100188 RepID=UPI0037E96DB3